MPSTPEIRFDVASVLSRGAREYQEDALATDFPMGADIAFAVLADGMGGHAAGDLASKIVVTEVYAELKFQSGDAIGFEENVGEILRHAAVVANDCVRAHTAGNPDCAGMGATLVAPVFIGDRLTWISIGDSPFFMFRDGRLTQLNEDHSLGPQIDFMVRSGMMSAEVAKHHPDRNALTSVLIGEEIERVDCPDEPMLVYDGDIFIVASDGLQFLGNAVLTDILHQVRGSSATRIAELLLDAVDDLGDPEQDNVSFSVIKAFLSDRATRSAEIVTPEFEGRPTSRPVNETVAAREAVAGDDAPIYLRRRWLATDGGTF